MERQKGKGKKWREGRFWEERKQKKKGRILTEISKAGEVPAQQMWIVPVDPKKLTGI